MRLEIRFSLLQASALSACFWHMPNSGAYVAACVEFGVDTLYTEDLQAGAKYDGLSVVNPFVSA